MDRMLLIAGLMASAIVAGCGSLSPNARSQAPAVAAQATPIDAAARQRDGDRIIVNDGAGSVVVQKVEVRPGVSSVTVERLARSAGCAGSRGAGLITEKGPVEIYRMQCDNGVTFMAKCELRQCKPMR
jgi:hypothetical protein